MSSISRERAKPTRRRVGKDPYEAFLAFVEQERSAMTRVSYGRILRQLQASYPTPFELTAEQVRDWLARPVGDQFHASRPRATSTKRTETGCLKGILAVPGRHLRHAQHHERGQDAAPGPSR